MTDVANRPGPTSFATTTGERNGPRPFTPSPSRLLTPLTLLVLANAVSLSGNVITTVAIPWLVLTTTGSAALTGIAVFAGVGGAAVGGLAAGRIVDAIGPVRTSSAADLLSGLAVAPLPILLALDALEIWHVVLLAIVGTLADSAGSTARQSLVPAAADSGGYKRERANALFTSAEHVGYLLGAPIAGLLIAAFDVGGALLVTVASFAFAALVVAGLVHLPRPRAVTATAESAGLREAIAFIWGDPALRALFVFPTVAVLLVGPLAPIVLPVLAREAFGDPVVLGVMVASYGAGGLLGAAGFGMFGSRVPRRRLYIGVFVVWPCTYAAITLVPFLPFTLAMLLTLGAAAGSLVPLQATIRQERSPARLLPRVVGLSTGSVPVAAPIGVLVTGFLIDGLGLHQTLLLMTAGAALIGTTVLTSKGTRVFDANEATQPGGGVRTVPVSAGGGCTAQGPLDLRRDPAVVAGRAGRLLTLLDYGEVQRGGGHRDRSSSPMPAGIDAHHLHASRTYHPTPSLRRFTHERCQCDIPRSKVTACRPNSISASSAPSWPSPRSFTSPEPPIASTWRSRR